MGLVDHYACGLAQPVIPRVGDAVLQLLDGGDHDMGPILDRLSFVRCPQPGYGHESSRSFRPPDITPGLNRLLAKFPALGDPKDRAWEQLIPHRIDDRL